MNRKEEPKIIQKCYDMIQYAYLPLKQYDKSERHTLVAETKRCMYELLRLLIRADKRYFKKNTLQDADIELKNLAYMVRLGLDLGFLPIGQYKVWVKMNEEIGRMLGGWIKSSNK